MEAPVLISPNYKKDFIIFPFTSKHIYEQPIASKHT